MKTTLPRPRALRKMVLTVSVGISGLFCALQASAGCGNLGVMPSQGWRDLSMGTTDRFSAGGLSTAMYRPGSERLIRVSDNDDRHSGGIVGTWRFNFVSDGNAYPVPIPYGAPIDFGTQQWHSDGTEFIISGGRAPSSGDVCMGVWERTGPRTYRMKHVALAYLSSDSTPAASPATFLGPAVMHEEVALSASGKSFEGTFTIDQYAKDETTLIEHISGKVTATRLTID
jgi:hypothetical protein